jgi:hypothetical protein
MVCSSIAGSCATTDVSRTVTTHVSCTVDMGQQADTNSASPWAILGDCKSFSNCFKWQKFSQTLEFEKKNHRNIQNFQTNFFMKPFE